MLICTSPKPPRNNVPAEGPRSDGQDHAASAVQDGGLCRGTGHQDGAAGHRQRVRSSGLWEPQLASLHPGIHCLLPEGAFGPVPGPGHPAGDVASPPGEEAGPLWAHGVHIFPGNSMLCLMCGDMETAASEQKSAAAGYKIRNRFADYMLILQGPSIRSAVFRELDEDCGPAPPGAVQGEQFTQGDQMAQQFLPFFYGQLDDPAKRGGLNDLFKDLSVVNCGERHVPHHPPHCTQDPLHAPAGQPNCPCHLRMRCPPFTCRGVLHLCVRRAAAAGGDLPPAVHRPLPPDERKRELLDLEPHHEAPRGWLCVISL
eukprot:Sspe_Gene.17685::Locus_6290_Transcript_1_1_Confidence_1.000_Length_985::g.17685::m.17685